MEYLAPAIQLILGLGILNVWLLRRTKVTPYRVEDPLHYVKNFERTIFLTFSTILLELLNLLLPRCTFRTILWKLGRFWSALACCTHGGRLCDAPEDSRPINKSGTICNLALALFGIATS